MNDQQPGSLSDMLPGAELDLQDAGLVAELFERARELSLSHPHRHGATVELAGPGRLVMSGDLHDNGPNLARILKLAALDRSDTHYVVLHELIHGPWLVNGRDLSVRLMARVAALMAAHPQQVLVLMGNHELAQLGGAGITKDGVNVVEAFNAGLSYLYGDEAERVSESLEGFIRAMLLAVRCEQSSVMCCHSLPSPRRIEKFDKDVIARVPEPADLTSGGAAYDLVWGRNQTQKVMDELAAAWGVETFVVGHQPAEMGYELLGERMLILASDHEHGCALPIDLGRPQGRDELMTAVMPLNAVG